MQIGVGNATYGPTATHKATMEIIKHQLADLNQQLGIARVEMEKLEKALKAAGAPRVE